MTRAWLFAWRLELALISALLISALLAACARPSSSSSPARFPHALHLAKPTCGAPGLPKCPTCTSCHAVSGGDQGRMLPAVSECSRCHRASDSNVLSTLSSVPVRPNGDILFDHDRHLAMPEIRGQCVGCHGGIFRREQPNLPPMSQCFGCHEHEQQWQRAECAPCHESKDLKHIIPRTLLRHDAAFARRHGQPARENTALCRTCHSESECNACHDTSQGLSVETRRPDAVEASFVHRGDFMTRHAVEAQATPARCATCHSPQSCDSCHLARGVSGNLPNGRSPHPPGWVGTNTSTRSFHGVEARRDIFQCAACHEQGAATNCIRCHKVGAYGGNPHPSGWRSNESTDSQMCRYCHE